MAPLFVLVGKNHAREEGTDQDRPLLLYSEFTGGTEQYLQNHNYNLNLNR